jgi:hypothetical protein
MSRILSLAASPAALLYVLVVFAQAAAGVYTARGLELPPGFRLLYAAGLMWAMARWLRADARGRGVDWVWVLDLGIFLYVAWPFIMPYYLFKTRGAKAILAVLAFAGVYLLAFAAGAVLYVVLAV